MTPESSSAVPASLGAGMGAMTPLSPEGMGAGWESLQPIEAARASTPVDKEPAARLTGTLGRGVRATSERSLGRLGIAKG